MLTFPYGLPQDSATPADWRRFWHLVEDEIGLTEQQVRAMMGWLPLPPHLGTPEGYAQTSGRRGANLAHLFSKVRGWTAHGLHLKCEAPRQAAPATPPQWPLVKFGEIPIAQVPCPECGAPLPPGYGGSCPACLARDRQN